MPMLLDNFRQNPRDTPHAKVFNLIVVKLAVRIKSIVPLGHEAQATLPRVGMTEL
jgi:hypothetical protein